MELKVFNTKGEETGKTVKLPEEIFNITPNDHAIYLDVKRYLASLHRGTHKAKEVSELSGSTRKIKRQKGTGTARAGSIKNPLFKGGARTFGPRVRSYDIKLNKKVKTLARKSALSYKAKEEKIIVLDQVKFESPKTKEFLEILKKLKVDSEKTLLVVANKDKNISLSARNLSKSNVVEGRNLNTYDVMNVNKLIFVADGLDSLKEVFATN